MLESRKQFWDVRDFDEELRKNLLNVFENLLMYFKIFRFMTYATMSLILFTPLLSQDGTLPFASWYSDGYPYVFEGLYGFQCMMLAAIATEVIGFDCLFAALCWELIVQFKLLNHRLCNSTITNENINEECFGNFKAFVDHHNFLLRQEYYYIKCF